MLLHLTLQEASFGRVGGNFICGAACTKGIEGRNDYAIDKYLKYYYDWHVPYSNNSLLHHKVVSTTLYVPTL